MVFDPPRLGPAGSDTTTTPVAIDGAASGCELTAATINHQHAEGWFVAALVLGLRRKNFVTTVVQEDAC